MRQPKEPRPGLVGGPSRKQVDPFTARTGEYVQPERRTTQTFSNSAGGDGTYTLYTCPVNKRAKIIFYQLINESTTAGLVVGGQTILVLNNPDTQASLQLPYETGIDISGGQTVSFYIGVGSGAAAFATIIVVEEDAYGGYFSN